MTDPYVGEIRIFPFNFAPSGWAFCDGQILPISQNVQLFAIVGTIYGGNGTSTFALPDLRGSVPMHPGTGNGLSPHDIGEVGGEVNVTLTQNEMAAHSHKFNVVTQDPADVQKVGPNTCFDKASGGQPYQDTSTSSSTLASQALKPQGGGMPHNNMQPFLTLYFNIALKGIFPSRN